MSKERGHRAIASKRGAIYIDEIPRDRVPHLFQLKNAPRQFGFPGAGGAHQEQRIASGDGDLFDPVNQLVESRVLGIDSSFQVGNSITRFLTKSRSNSIVLREIKIDDLYVSRCVSIAIGRQTEAIFPASIVILSEGIDRSGQRECPW